MKLLDLGITHSLLSARLFIKNSFHAFNRLALPIVHLVGVNLIGRGDLLNRPVSTQGGQNNLFLEGIAETTSLRHKWAPNQISDTP